MRAALALALVGALAGVSLLGTPASAQTAPATGCVAGVPCPTPAPAPPAPPTSTTVPTGTTAPTSTVAPGSGGGGGILGCLGSLVGLGSGCSNPLSALNPITWIDDVITAAVRPVFEAWGAVVFVTPDLIGNNAVRTMWITLLALSDACLVIVVLIAAHRVTWGNLVAQSKAKHGLERIVVGAAGAHLNLLILAPLAATANALAIVLLQVGGDNLQVRVETLMPLVVSATTNPLMVLFGAAVMVTAILVVFWSLVRWVVFAMVTALGGPAHYALALDQEQMTRAWWRCELILLFVPVLQVVCYDLAIWLFFSPESILPGGSSFLSAMGLLVLMWCLYHIPKVALRHAAAPLMQAYDAAKGKLKLAVGLAAIGIGAATGVGLGGIGARGFSAAGLMRSLVGRAGRRRAAERRRTRRPPPPPPTRREPPIHVKSERIS
jgi:hypothetical protein